MTDSQTPDWALKAAGRLCDCDNCYYGWGVCPSAVEVARALIEAHARGVQEERARCAEVCRQWASAYRRGADREEPTVVYRARATGCDDCADAIEREEPGT